MNLSTQAVWLNMLDWSTNFREMPFIARQHAHLIHPLLHTAVLLPNKITCGKYVARQDSGQSAHLRI